jgi:hypothetical protein
MLCVVLLLMACRNYFYERAMNVGYTGSSLSEINPLFYYFADMGHIQKLCDGSVSLVYIFFLVSLFCGLKKKPFKDLCC